MKKAMLKAVNIIDVLGQVVDHNNHNYQSDFEYDKVKLLGAKAGDTFVWLSRRNGTWLFNERDVYIKSTSSNHTWSYYGGSKSENVKAYLVEITGDENHQPTGDIVEMDYEKHLDYLTAKAQKPIAVELMFKNPNSIRTFSVSEYHQNSQEITRRYGNIDRAEYKVSNEFTLEDVMQVSKAEIKENTIEMDVSTYFYEMEKQDFEERGYDIGDNAFLNHNDAESAVTFNLNVTSISRSGEETKVRSMDDYYEKIETMNIFTTTKEEKNFLKHLQSDTPPLFTDEENELLFDCVLQAAKENKVENLVALDTVLYKLEHLIPKFGQELDNTILQEHETELEQ